MTTQLYLVPLPDAQATEPPTQGVRSRVTMEGLLEQSGVATEKIATENVDLTVRGNINLGKRFSKIVKREIQSLAASTYSDLALYDASASDLGDDRGYYELQNADVNPAHKSTQDAFQYVVTLSDAGTANDSWRSVTTNVEPIETNLADGSGGLIGVPTEATKTRWFDTGQGTEGASVNSTVAAELGDVDLYDPASASFSNPTLLYECPYDAEGDVDVRVWDDHDRSKFHTLSDGTEVRQWTHAYHTSFDFSGDPVVDNGLLRLRFDEANSVIDADEWDDAGASWVALDTVGSTDWELFDADIQSIAPAAVDVYTEWENTTTGSIHAAVVSVQRGITRAVLREPPNDGIPSGLETEFDPIASNQTTDPTPSQGVTPRSEVK